MPVLCHLQRWSDLIDLQAALLAQCRAVSGTRGFLREEQIKIALRSNRMTTGSCPIVGNSTASRAVRRDFTGTRSNRNWRSATGL